MAINRLNPDYPDAGIVQLIPTSVSVGSGSSTISGNGQVSFSGASSVSLDGIFNSTYTNYLIKFNATSLASGDADLALYFRSGSGTDVTNNNVSEILIQYSTSISANESTVARFGATSANYSTFSNYTLQVSNPNLSTTTTYESSGSFVTNAGIPYQYRAFGYNFSTTVMTGIKLYPTASNFSGTVSVYGYRN